MSIEKSEVNFDENVIGVSGGMVQKMDTPIELFRILKTKQNALAPVSRLPPEILSNVFFQTREFVLSNDRWSLDWIAPISHVCQHWRDVALADPNLWTCIVFDRLQRAEELLKRSGMAPLIIKARISDLSFLELFDLVCSAMQHLPRTLELYISASKEDMEEILAGAISLDAPLLETLCLFNTHDSPDDSTNFDFPKCFDNSICLRRVELINCNFSWHSPLLVGLTHLKLHNIYPRPTTKELLNALEKLPLLETLDILDSFPLLHAPHDRVITLPSLSLLCLTSPVLECVNILKHLSYPPSTTLILDCKAIAHDVISGLISVLPPVCRGEGPLAKEETINILTIDSPNPFIFHLLAYSSHRPSQAFLEITWTLLGREPHRMFQLVSELCDALPLANTTSLTVYKLDLPRMNWLQICGGLSRLENIHVRGQVACGIIDALESELPSDDQTTTTCCFPALKKLVLEGVHFFGQEALELGKLRDCLTKRSRLSTEIRELHFRTCHYLSCKDVDESRAAVGCIEWDLIEDFHEEDGRNHWIEVWDSHDQSTFLNFEY